MTFKKIFICNYCNTAIKTNEIYVLLLFRKYGDSISNAQKSTHACIKCINKVRGHE